MSQTIIPPKKLHKQNRSTKPVYAEDVSEVEADLLSALKIGRLPRLLWDDPEYIEAAILDGSTIAQMRHDRAEYEEAWDYIIRQAKRVIKLDKKRRKKAKA